MEQVTATSFLLFQQDAATVTLNCGSIVKRASGRGLLVVRVPSGCTADTASFVLDGTTDVYIGPVRLDIEGELPHLEILHPDDEGDLLEALDHRLQLVGKATDLNIPDLVKEFAGKRVTRVWTITVTMVLLAVAGIVIALVVIKLRRRYRDKKEGVVRFSLTEDQANLLNHQLQQAQPQPQPHIEL